MLSARRRVSSSSASASSSSFFHDPAPSGAGFFINFCNINSKHQHTSYLLGLSLFPRALRSARIPPCTCFFAAEKRRCNSAHDPHTCTLLPCVCVCEESVRERVRERVSETVRSFNSLTTSLKSTALFFRALFLTKGLS